MVPSSLPTGFTAAPPLPCLWGLEEQEVVRFRREMPLSHCYAPYWHLVIVISKDSTAWPFGLETRKTRP